MDLMNELFEKNLNLCEDLSNNMTKLYLMAKDNKLDILAATIENVDDKLDDFGDFFHSLKSKFDKICKENDEVILQKLFDKGHEILSEVSKTKLSDPEFMLKAIELNTTSLSYASESLKNSRDFITKVLNKDGWAILYASDELRNNSEMAYLAVANSFTSIQCLPEEMCDIETIVLIASNGPDQESMMEYASDRLKNCKVFASKMLYHNGMTLSYFSKEIRSDRDLIELAMVGEPESYHYIDKSLENDKKLALKAIELSDGCSSLYSRLPEELKNDIEIVLMATDKNPDLYIEESTKKKILELFS
jgi:hypothetical protein